MSRNQYYLSVLLLLLALLLVIGCDTVEGERTATPDQGARATVAAVATENAPLATQHAKPSITASLSAQATAVVTIPTRDPSSYLEAELQGGALGEVWNLADVRLGLHPDRLRVVWEMAEARDHVPWYRVVEVDNATSPFPTGGEPAWGAARIDLIISDLYAFDFPLGQRLPLVPSENPLLTRVGVYPTFSDSELGFSIGLKTPSAYEVHELTDPVRIVVVVPYSE